jgi:hypothetical protein
MLDHGDRVDTRLEQLNKDVLLVNKTLGEFDYALGQVDKGMVQLDHGMNRVDKEMVRFGKALGHLNKSLGINVEDLERELNARIETLKVRFEAEHSKAMEELLSVTKFEPFTRTFENLKVFATEEDSAAPEPREHEYATVELAPIPEPAAPPRKPAAATPQPATARPLRPVPASWEKSVKPAQDASLEREPYADSATARHFAAVLEEIKQLRNGR